MRSVQSEALSCTRHSLFNQGLDSNPIANLCQWLGSCTTLKRGPQSAEQLKFLCKCRHLRHLGRLLWQLIQTVC